MDRGKTHEPFITKTFFLLHDCVCSCLAIARVRSRRAGADAADAQFKAMDLDGDGRLTPAEHAAGARRMFVAMDANGDGKVTAAEMDAAQEKVTGRKAGPSDMSSADKIKVVDTDGDGILTADEHATASRAMFEKMDTDKDGFVSKAEFAA